MVQVNISETSIQVSEQKQKTVIYIFNNTVEVTYCDHIFRHVFYYLKQKI